MPGITPEGRVKIRVNAVLDKYHGSIYIYMPVPSGYGKSTLDYVGCFYGQFFAIETKRGSKAATLRQEGIIDDMQAARARVFRINDDTGVTELEQWLEAVEAAMKDCPAWA